MCDYSLAEVRSRLAMEGEDLTVHRFPTLHSSRVWAETLRAETLPAPKRNSPGTPDGSRIQRARTAASTRLASAV